jgi:YD repeat-containing protein
MMAYGNPTTIKEVGTNGGSRTTTQSYFIDTGKWMVNLPKDESFAGHSLKRTYDGNGNVTSVNNNGVVTSFVYFGDGRLIRKLNLGI